MKNMVKIHFLNVGCGDCTIIHFPRRVRKDGKIKPERIMMIDIYHHENHDEYENIIDYYKKHFRNSDGSLKSIFRFVCTHPHQDHICGLSKLFSDSKIKIWNFWDLDHSFEPENFDGHETHEDDWNAYQEKRKSNCGDLTVIKTYREDKPRDFWNDNEDRITVLSPSKEMIKKVHEDKEDGTKRKPHEIKIDQISYALMIKVNNKKIIFAGDGKEQAWCDILENCAENIKDCHILKAGHHGHESALHEDAVKHMNPKYVVFSNSIDEDKENGAEDKYAEILPNTTIYKTFLEGSIIASCPLDEEKEIYFNKA